MKTQQEADNIRLGLEAKYTCEHEQQTGTKSLEAKIMAQFEELESMIGVRWNGESYTEI